MDEIEVINPKRRRKSSRRRRTVRRSASRRRVRRNPVMSFNARRRKTRSYRVTTRSRHIRRNPGGGSVVNSAMDVLKDGAIGVVGIAANNAIGNTVSDLIKITDPTLRKGVKVVSAVLLPTLVGMVLPSFKRQAAVGGAAALACIGAQLLEEKVYPMLGPQVSRLLSSGNGYGGTTTSGGGATNDPPEKVGYLPGTNRYVGYLPGARNYVGNRMPTMAMVNHF